MINEKSQIEFTILFVRALSICRSKKPRSPKHSASRNQDTLNVFTPASSRNSTSNLENSSFHNEPCSLSDLQAVDMSLQNLPQNPSATSMQSFVSVLEAVDVPVFEDSQNTEPLSPNELELGLFVFHIIHFLLGKVG